MEEKVEVKNFAQMDLFQSLR